MRRGSPAELRWHSSQPLQSAKTGQPADTLGAAPGSLSSQTPVASQGWLPLAALAVILASHGSAPLLRAGSRGSRRAGSPTRQLSKAHARECTSPSSSILQHLDHACGVNSSRCQMGRSLASGLPARSLASVSGVPAWSTASVCSKSVCFPQAVGSACSSAAGERRPGRRRGRRPRRQSLKTRHRTTGGGACRMRRGGARTTRPRGARALALSSSSVASVQPFGGVNNSSCCYRSGRGSQSCAVGKELQRTVTRSKARVLASSIHTACLLMSRCIGLATIPARRSFSGAWDTAERAAVVGQALRDAE